MRQPSIDAKLYWIRKLQTELLRNLLEDLAELKNGLGDEEYPICGELKDALESAERQTYCLPTLVPGWKKTYKIINEFRGHYREWNDRSSCTKQRHKECEHLKSSARNKFPSFSKTTKRRRKKLLEDLEHINPSIMGEKIYQKFYTFSSNHKDKFPRLYQHVSKTLS